MIKKYLGDLAIVQLLNLLVKPIWIFAIDNTVQNKLPKEDYGTYFTFLSFTFLFTVFLDFGITSFNTISLSENKDRLRNRFYRLLSLKIVLASIYLLIVLTFGWILGYMSYSFTLLLMVTLIQIFASFNLFFRGSLAAFEFFKLDGLFMVLDRTLMIILCGLMIWMPGFLELNIQHFVLIQLLVLMVVSITLIITLYQKMETFKLALDFSGLRRILSKSWPFGVLFALMSLYHYLDSVMLEKLSSNGVTDVSIYAQGYRIFYALLLFSHVFSNIMLPIFSKQKRNPSQLISFVDYNTRLLLWIAISVAFIGWSYKLEIMQILFPNKNPELAAMPFGLIILGYIGTVLMVLFGTFLTALRQLKILNWLVFFTVIINVVLNAIFIPLYGVTGAAFATLISQFLLGLSSFISTKSILTNWMVTRTIFQILTFASLFGLLAIILKTTFTNPIIHLGLCATAIISGGLILRLRKG